ncbi:MAG TPA: EAL domain-containing protein [Pyrinomonadaceae bacterium]|nr:EAL domain-containing protein [Pyrinomonadaceae bacterium]
MQSMNTDLSVGGVSCRSRAENLFDEHRQAIFKRTDRMFAVLMLIQWVAGIAAALWLSPKTWAGSHSQTHIHVWAAVFLGSAISLFPITLALLRPGETSTRYIIATAQVLMSSLLIHLTGGRIETHFHVFGSLAFISCYRDWRVLIPATVVVAADHFLRGVFWPESVYGVLTVSNWRWLEHAGWVLFEDAFLCIAIKRNIAEMWDIAERTDEIKGLNEGLETRVAERTTQLVTSNEELTREVAERKQVEEQLLHNAFHDGLTGLANRALFIDHLHLALGHAQRHEAHQFAVLFLDLDRFKTVNDSLGHMAGDHLLVEIARRLERVMRPGDTVSRLGGDEFAVLLDDLGDAAEAETVAKRLQRELAVPCDLGGQEVVTTVSIGIALSSNEYQRPEDLLRDADTAMYRAKKLGKARHEVFEQAMHASAMDLLGLERDLRWAVERGELFLQYQPIVSLGTGALRGFEALVRWQHPTRGLIQPTKFIPIAEETGLIIPIGKWVLGEACRQMRQWQLLSHTNEHLPMNVNLSGKQFMQPDLLDQIREVLQQTGLDPRCLKLEITETVVMDNIETAIRTLEQLRELGVELGIDDFGTGYSSLSYLQRFPVGTLKIDRSFISRITERDGTAEIVSTIMKLAQTLGMDVVAEGVETEQQRAQLTSLECELGQGYYFSRPIDSDDAEAFFLKSFPPAGHLLQIGNSRVPSVLAATDAIRAAHGNAGALQLWVESPQVLSAN